MPIETIYFASLFLLGTVITFGLLHDNRPLPAQLLPPVRGVFKFVYFLSALSNLVLLAWGVSTFGWTTAGVGLIWSVVGGTIHARFYGDLFALFSFVYFALGFGLGIYVYVSA